MFKIISILDKSYRFKKEGILVSEHIARRLMSVSWNEQALGGLSILLD